MSFPKAKIHRFNEDISCAPPPGTYDPKLDTKVKGTPNQKVKRKFPDQQCSSTSLDSLYNKSSNTKMTFRTPQVTRKFTVKPRVPHDTIVDKQGSLGNARSTTDGKVFKMPISSIDCQRLEQHQTVHADTHVSEMNRLKDHNLKLQESLKEVEHREAIIKLSLEEKIALGLKAQNELIEVTSNLDNIDRMIIKEREEYANYTKELKYEIALMKDENKHLERVVAENESVIETLTERYTDLKTEFKLWQERNEKETEYIKEENLNLINNLLLESKNQIGQFEESMKNNVFKLETEFDNVQETATVELQTKIKHLLDHEFEPKIHHYEICLKTYIARIEELQRFVDQKEKEYFKCIEEVDERCRIMYRELYKVEIQRDELIASDLGNKITMMDLQKKSESIEEDLKLCREKCKKYEITLRTMHGTVNALSNRLFESENEVLRLNGINYLLECERKGLDDNSLLSNVSGLRTVMNERMEAKLDNFKMEVEKNVQILKDDIYYKQSAINNLQKELDNVNSQVVELKGVKMSNEDIIMELKRQIDDYQFRLCNAEKEVQLLKNENITLVDSNRFLKDQIESVEEIIEKKNQNEVQLQQCIDGLFSDLVLEKKQSKSLEIEKNKIKTDLSKIERSFIKKEHEIKELNLRIESMDRSLNNLEERVTLTDEEKGILEMQLLNAENNTLELKLANEALLKSNEELGNIVIELHHLLSKEEFKNELPNVVDKAASLNVDAVTKTVRHKSNSNLRTKDGEAEKEKMYSQVMNDGVDNGMNLQEATEEKCGLQELWMKNTTYVSESSEPQITEHLKAVIEKRNNHADSLKEQNIEEFDMLKKTYIELGERAEQLERENSVLKRKLAETKENTNSLRLENSPKVVKNLVEKMSPGILKDRNC